MRNSKRKSTTISKKVRPLNREESSTKEKFENLISAASNKKIIIRGITTKYKNINEDNILRLSYTNGHEMIRRRRSTMPDNSKSRITIWVLFFVVKFTQVLKKRVINSKLEKLSELNFKMIGDITYFTTGVQELKLKVNLAFATKKKIFIESIISNFSHAKSIIKCHINWILKKFHLFNPENIFLILFKLLLMLSLFFNVFYIPILIAFPEILDDGNRIENLFFYELPTVFIFLNALLSLNSSYYSKGTYIVDRKMIFQNYLRANLGMDILTLLPYLLMYSIPSPYTLLVFLIRFVSFQNLVKNFEKQLLMRGKTKGFYQLIMLILNIVIISHIFGCIWILIGKIEVENNIPNSWLSIIQSNGDSNFENFDVYINALYYAIVTMITVGYGDIYPSNTFEKCFGIVFMLLSCGVFAYSLNSVGSIIEEMNKIQKEFNSKITDIEYYMKNQGISKSLQIRIKKYLEYMQEEALNRGTDSGQVLMKNLSPKLREEFLFDYNYPTLSKNEFFRNFSQPFLAKLSQKCGEMIFAPGEVILNTNDPENQNFYIVKAGSVECVAITTDEDQNCIHELIISRQNVNYAHNLDWRIFWLVSLL